ncbi:xanthine dehydrogenase family protein subunit M [Streptomyces sp. MNU89]|uniref:FAD binding domain-containing protein n=1 Tax=Streptomyces sp. MNU89 TaxID=2560025 RepID=UPI001E48B8EC|nr:xanthine dehydrogenase family protein subunit M [Streptomyces sp. MNU89]MCC9740863.1 xanthine dehydrogenase family protein subunit M [Streptomyces sp. MNU89]
MREFTFTTPESTDRALAEAHHGTGSGGRGSGRDGGAAYLAGGTTLVDLMKLGVLAPSRVIDINGLPLHGIRADEHGLRIGALERMGDVAADVRVRERYPVLAEALLASASQQIRNMASMGGNLLQRTRCPYFRDPGAPCNRRDPGSGCPAVTGHHRNHAVLGTSDACIAAHPSDLAVALVALDASVRVLGPGRDGDKNRDGDRGRGSGSRTVLLADLHRLPGDTPHIETSLRPGELITEITVPPLPRGTRSGYLKIRDRQSYEFALCSAAVALSLRGNTITGARVAVGGVGTKPWRLPAVEAALTGRPATESVYEKAAGHAAEGARPLRQNRFKVTLVQRAVVRALMSLGD